MFTETGQALSQDFDLVPSFSTRMEDINRLSLVTNRLLRSFLLFPTPETRVKLNLIDVVDYLQILHIISEIAWNVNIISSSIVELNKQNLPKKILEPLFQVSLAIQRTFDNSINALLSKDINLANQNLDNMPAIELNLEELWNFFREADTSKVSPLVLSSAYLLIDCLKRINRHSAELSEITINRAEADSVTGQRIETKNIV
jgi:hypothetical protein